MNDEEVLLPQHKRLIDESGISEEVADARRYRSMTDKDEVRRLGFEEWQCLVPALLVPVWGVDGKVRIHQLRPDSPRKDKKGKNIKYETPAGSQMALDVHPSIRNQIGNPRVPLYITEGIRKADSAISHGLCCVALLGVWNWRGTNEHGGKTALPDWEMIALNGRLVYIAFDSDAETKPQVYRAMIRLKAFLEMNGAKVQIICLPPGANGEKVGLDDYLAAGHSVERLLSLAKATPESGTEFERPGSSLGTKGPRWPDPLGEKAYYGLAGDIVRAIEPHTEADPAALLFQFLTAFGNVIGRSAYFLAEADQHYTNLFTIQVGVTSRGRKGTSLGQVLRPFKMVDPEWISDRKQSGLSTGEGLIWGVRDQIEKTEPIKENRQVTGYQQVVIDEGITDKRLFVVEEEFAQTLRVLGREGNTLSPVIRNAWDSGNLSILTKNSPARATGAHISIIGHITKDELLRYLDSTESGNGFANRFLWVGVKRSKVLPEGGRIAEVDFEPLVERLKQAVEYGRVVGEIRRDEEARKLWYKVYPVLSDGKPGLFGSVTARAEAQVMRVACIYALLDCSAIVRREHLVAGLEVWRYSEASAGFIFGDSLGNPVADELIRALRSTTQGMTRTDINNYFGRNKSSAEIGRALTVLTEHNLVQAQLEAQDEGRSAQRWFAVQPPSDESVPDNELDETDELEGDRASDDSCNSSISYAPEDSEETLEALNWDAPDHPCPNCGETDWRYEECANNGKGGWVCRACWQTLKTQDGTEIGTDSQGG